MSTGVPNGPYEGPVYAKRFDAGEIELYGSDTWEGTYFVFIEMLSPPVARGAEEPARRGVSEDFMARVEAAERRDEESSAEARSEAARVERVADEAPPPEGREVDAAAEPQDDDDDDDDAVHAPTRRGGGLARRRTRVGGCPGRAGAGAGAGGRAGAGAGARRMRGRRCRPPDGRVPRSRSRPRESVARVSFPTPFEPLAWLE